MPNPESTYVPQRNAFLSPHESLLSGTNCIKQPVHLNMRSDLAAIGGRNPINLANLPQ
jgi:hypothetical protein